MSCMTTKDQIALSLSLLFIVARGGAPKPAHAYPRQYVGRGMAECSLGSSPQTETTL